VYTWIWKFIASGEWEKKTNTRISAKHSKAKKTKTAQVDGQGSRDGNPYKGIINRNETTSETIKQISMRLD